MWPFGWKMHRRRGLRFWILSLLAESPKNGAEIMSSIEDASQGWWRPSPGTVYPLLTSLKDEGLIAQMPDGRYELTDRSREEMNWPPGFVGRRQRNSDGMLNEMKGYVSYFEDLDRSDKKKMDTHRDEIRKLAERLQNLARGGGDTS